ncbi:cation:proton antiporter [Terriglobus sp.]|uniref:cation:proton antiporter n=1 Tax=Terriglobus sp. TaxID=1889013 RepID=UPI003AFFD1A3
MTAWTLAQAVLLGIVVLSCWLGVLGTWRMRDATQSLHFITLPATAGAVALTAAVFIATGNGITAWKTVLIAIVMITLNSVGMHASARAFRARQLGHWEPRNGDSFEWVRAGVEEEPGK